MKFICRKSTNSRFKVEGVVVGILLLQFKFYDISRKSGLHKTFTAETRRAQRQFGSRGFLE